MAIDKYVDSFVMVQYDFDKPRDLVSVRDIAIDFEFVCFGFFEASE
jgi:hypothetical protein